MDVKSVRVANMELLANEAGSISALARLINISPNYLYQIRSGSGGRTMGDKMARQIEAAMGREYGWMDMPHNIDQVNESMSCYETRRNHHVEPDLDMIARAIKDAEAVTAGSDLTPTQKARIVINILKSLQEDEVDHKKEAG